MVNAVIANALDLFNNCCSFVTCDQKTSLGFSFRKIYRHQQQGNTRAARRKPLLASRVGCSFVGDEYKSPADQCDPVAAVVFH